MKHYESMIDMGCFSRSELSKSLKLGDATTGSLLQQYQKKGYIERVRHDFYVVISIENKQPILSRYEIASRLFSDACVSNHSAFEVYGYANQVFYEVYIMTNSRFNDFEYDGVRYHQVSWKGDAQIENLQGVRVTGIEKTVIDCINNIDKTGGIEELIRCILLIPSLNEEKLLNALKDYKKGFLYQKTGFILEQLRDELHLSDAFFKKCEANISKSVRYLSKEHYNYIYNQKWRIIGPKNIYELVDKGIIYDASS